MARRLTVKVVLLVTSTLLGACSSAPEASSTEQAPKPGDESADVLRFSREESGRQQSLELRKRSGGGFDVAIAVSGGCTRTETGSAKILEDEDEVEVEVDPKGGGHPTDGFTMTGKNKCQVTIRLAAPDPDFAWLRETDCSAECPLSSKAMPRK